MNNYAFISASCGNYYLRFDKGDFYDYDSNVYQKLITFYICIMLYQKRSGKKRKREKNQFYTRERERKRREMDYSPGYLNVR